MEEFFQRWLGPLVAAASFIFMVMSARGKATNDRVAAIEAKLETKGSGETLGLLVGKVDLAEDRISRLEGTIETLPSRDQTHELALALREMKGELGILTEKLRPISHTTERLQEFLIDEARTKRGAA